MAGEADRAGHAVTPSFVRSRRSANCGTDVGKKYGNSEGGSIHDEVIAVGADNAC